MDLTKNENLTILKTYEICNIMGVYNGRSAQEETTSKIQDEIPGEKLIVAVQSGHMVPFQQPKLIIDTIIEVIELTK